MYLHLGNDVIVPKKEIIGIFDIENTSVSKDTRAFLSAEAKKGEVIYITQELPKSFILCQRDGVCKTYVSQISAATLKKRQKM